MRIGNDVRKTSGNGNRKSIGDETRKGIGEEARKGIRNESHASAQETGCCGWNKKALTAKCDDGVRETVGSARTSRITPEWRVAVIWVPNQIFENRKAGARSRKRNRPIAFNHQRTTRQPPYRVSCPLPSVSISHLASFYSELLCSNEAHDRKYRSDKISRRHLGRHHRIHSSPRLFDGSAGCQREHDPQ
jgi:hypothetical protein